MIFLSLGVSSWQELLKHEYSDWISTSCTYDGKVERDWHIVNYIDSPTSMLSFIKSSLHWEQGITENNKVSLGLWCYYPIRIGVSTQKFKFTLNENLYYADYLGESTILIGKQH